MVLYAFLFIFGLIIGSFLNVIICRLDKEDGIATGRSHCPNCKKELQWFELIPILSFLIQKGKCKNCKRNISLQYPIVEFATGFLFAISLKILNFKFLIFDFQFLNLIYYLFIISLLIVIFIYDFKNYIIPNKIVYLGIAVAIFYNIFYYFLYSKFYIFNFLLSGFIASLFFLTMVAVSRGRWMGMGDVKLALLMGLFLGWPRILIAVLISFWCGAFVGIILIFLKKKNLKSQIPFGPFLVSGTVFSLFISDLFLRRYFDFLIK